MNFFTAVFFKDFGQIARYCFGQILTAQLPLRMTKVCLTEYRNCNFAKNNFFQRYYSRMYLHSRNTGNIFECLLLKKRAIFIFRSVKSDLSVRSIGWHNIAIDLGYTSFYLGVSR